MRVLRPGGEDNLTYVLLTDTEVEQLAELLRKPDKKLPSKVRTLAHDLRVALREARQRG